MRDPRRLAAAAAARAAVAGTTAAVRRLLRRKPSSFAGHRCGLGVGGGSLLRRAPYSADARWRGAACCDRTPQVLPAIDAECRWVARPGGLPLRRARTLPQPSRGSGCAQSLSALEPGAALLRPCAPRRLAVSLRRACRVGPPVGGWKSWREPEGAVNYSCSADGGPTLIQEPKIRGDCRMSAVQLA